MQIISYNKIKSKNIYSQTSVTKKNKPNITSGNYTKSYPMHNFYPNYIKFKGFKKITRDDLKDVTIPNLQVINSINLRGESLSHKRNIAFLPRIKNLGIKRIIDLKTSDHSEKFKQKVIDLGMEYLHFPVDSCGISDDKILEDLPLFFKAMDEGNYYIACAQGLHRTDIALSINYLFNKNTKTPPVLYGHIQKDKVRYDDIFKRTNSLLAKIKKDLSQNPNSHFYNFDEEIYKAKKKKLMELNNALAKS